MTYPIWSGINSDWVNSTEVNGVAATPTIVFDGFDSSQIPVLIGVHPGLYFEVMRAHFERKMERPVHEQRSVDLKSEGRDLATLPENRGMEAERSRKAYP